MKNYSKNVPLSGVDSRSIRDSTAKNVYVKQIGFATGENLYST